MTSTSTQIPKAPYLPEGAFLGGRFTPLDGADRVAVISPRDGSIMGKFHAGNSTHIDIAVKTARDAFENSGWAQASATHRGAMASNAAADPR